jgi:hypothetical protein
MDSSLALHDADGSSCECQAPHASLKTAKLETVKLETGFDMSANSKKSLSSTVFLIVLGIAALYGGTKTLAVLIPAALLVWFGVGPILRSGRN